jgi:hypothetical protein
MTGRRQVGAVLVAIVAVALGAAVARAEAPEFGRCVKQVGGKYANSNCTATLAGSEHFEWKPGPGPKAHFSESVSGTNVFKWKLASNEEGNCSGETATGEYTGPKTVAHVHIVLTGCSWGFVGSSSPCSTLTIASLGGEIGVYRLGETPLKNKIGLKLTPEVGEGITEFNCESGLNPYTWLGGWVIVPLHTNMMLASESLSYKQLHGPGLKEEQLPAGFVGEAANPLRADGNQTLGGERVFLPMGWQMTTTLVNEEKIETNSVL